MPKPGSAELEARRPALGPSGSQERATPQRRRRRGMYFPVKATPKASKTLLLLAPLFQSIHDQKYDYAVQDLFGIDNEPTQSREDAR